MTTGTSDGRRHIAISRFHDGDIRCVDFDTWSQAASRLTWPIGGTSAVSCLMNEINARGMRSAIQIKQCDNGELEVCDGHHRIVAARELGWAAVPYRWFVIPPG